MSESKEVEAILPAGTVVRVAGVPVRLVAAVPVRTTQSDWQEVERHLKPDTVAEAARRGFRGE